MFVQLSDTAQQTPFHFSHLLTHDKFIKYCKERGIRTSKKQLEDFEKLGVLYPAIRVKLGFYPEFRIKKDDGKWYRVNEEEYKKEREKPKETVFFHGTCTPKHLEKEFAFYKKENRIIFPAVEKAFTPWEELHFSLKRNKFEAKSVEDLGEECYQTYYSKYQMFILKKVQTMLSWKFTGSILDATDEDWIKRGQLLKERFKVSLEHARSFCEHRNMLVKLYCFIEEYNNARSDYANKDYLPSVQRLRDRLQKNSITKEGAQEEISELRKDALSRYKYYDENLASDKAMEILNDSGFTKNDLKDLYEQFAYELKFIDETEELYNFLDYVNRKILDKTKGNFRYVLDGHDLLLNISRFMRTLKIKHTSVKTLVTRLKDDWKECVICQRSFKPSKYNKRQITCSKTCSEENKRRKKENSD